MPYRPEYSEALSLIGKAITSLAAQGLETPVLVGGAAVEFYTGGAVTSGDFDLVTPYQQALETSLIELGFVSPGEPGMLHGGVIHPTLGLAVQVVSGQLMDGKADRERIRIVEVDGAEVGIIAIEDLIADRMGQAHSTSPPRKDMLDQALKLFQLADELDFDYLDRRIAEETIGSADLEALRGYQG